MSSKKRLLLDSVLYLVLDKDSCPRGDVVGILRKASNKGINIVQLRENTACDLDFLKDAEIIKGLCYKQGIVFLINNRLDIAQLVNADGLHLGQKDLPLRLARKILGRNKIIGVSCHNPSEALKAQAEGADYISIGPIFPTQTKPNLKPINLELLKIINQKLKIPYFAIGGINHSNIKKVLSNAIKRVALCRAICCAQDVKKATLELRNIIYDYAD